MVLCQASLSSKTQSFLLSFSRRDFSLHKQIHFSSPRRPPPKPTSIIRSHYEHFFSCSSAARFVCSIYKTRQRSLDTPATSLQIARQHHLDSSSSSTHPTFAFSGRGRQGTLTSSCLPHHHSHQVKKNSYCCDVLKLNLFRPFSSIDNGELRDDSS